MKNNRICQILGIEKPVIQGPLSWLTDARLVAAVSNAGGLGVLGPTRMDYSGNMVAVRAVARYLSRLLSDEN